MNSPDQKRYDMYCKMLCQISNSAKVQTAYELQLLANACRSYEKFALPEYPLINLADIAKGLAADQSIDGYVHDKLIFYNLPFPDGRTFLKFQKNVFFDPWNLPYIFDSKKRLISIDFSRQYADKNVLKNLQIHF